LQADEVATQRRGQDLGDLGLAHAGLAFEKQGPAHLQREKQHGRERTVGQIIGRRKQIEGGVD
jgi:hypothetical protein